MSTNDDRRFADVRPLFDAWHTAAHADRLPSHVTPAMRDARVLRMLDAVEGAVGAIRAKHPDLAPGGPLEGDLLLALMRAWLDGLKHHQTEAGPYLRQLLGAYLPFAPAEDLPAFERFADFLQSRADRDTTDN